MTEKLTAEQMEQMADALLAEEAPKKAPVITKKRGKLDEKTIAALPCGGCGNAFRRRCVFRRSRYGADGQYHPFCGIRRS